MNIFHIFQNKLPSEIETLTTTTEASTETSTDNEYTEKEVIVLDVSNIENRPIPNCNTEPAKSDESYFSDFDLKALLITSPHGNSILRHYDENKILTPSLRTILVDIIARHLYNYIWRQ